MTTLWRRYLQIFGAFGTLVKQKPAINVKID